MNVSGTNMRKISIQKTREHSLGCKYFYCKIRRISQSRKFLYNRLKLQLRYLY